MAKQIFVNLPVKAYGWQRTADVASATEDRLPPCHRAPCRADARSL